MMKRLAGILFVAVAVVALAALPAAAQAKDHKDIKYPKLPDFMIPQPEVYMLDNGLQVFLLEDHELPLIDVTGYIRTGSNYDPAAKVGLADIFGQVQREGGTTKMSGDEMDDFLEARAASIETGMGGDIGFASMNCLKEDFADVFRVFADVLRTPAFEQDKIDVAKVQTTTGIARRNDQIAGIAGREFSRLIYGQDTALGRLTEYATVDAITRDDLVAWHKKYYHPNNVMLGIVGDFEPAQMKKVIADTFGNWPEGPAFSDPKPNFASAKPGYYFIPKEDVTQAYVRMGHLGIQTQNPDYFAVQVMNEAFGGGFSARLFSRVRSQKGLAYSVGGGIGANAMRPGVFQLALSTKSETMAAAVDALKEEIDNIINDPVSKDELQKAKEAILNSFVFNYASPEQILGQQMTYAYYGQADFLATYRDKIEAVTAKDVARVAREYIHPDQLIVLVVGRSDGFDRPVDSFGPVATLDIAIPPPPDKRAKVERTADSMQKGSALFAEASKKLGAEGLTIESVEASYSVVVKMGGQSVQLGQDIAYSLPDKLRSTLKTPMGEQVTVLNGEKGVNMVGTQSQAMPQDRVKDTLRNLHRDLLFLATHAGSPELETVAAGDDEVGGTHCSIVAVVLDETESQLCIDANGMVIRQAYQGKHPLQGTPGLIEIVFQDYADVDGVRLPHKQVMSFEGQEVLTSTLQSMKINPDLDASLFALPN